MFGFLKRWFGRSAVTSSAPPAKAAASVKPFVAVPPAMPLPDLGDVSADETLIYRRDSASRGGDAYRNRHVAPPPDGAAIRLAVLTGSKRGQRFAVPPQGAVIGRSATCDLVLEDHHVSSRHAWIGFVDGGAVIQDQNSTNGTFLNANAQNVAALTPLAIGDTIMLGGHYGVQLRVVADSATTS